MLLVASVSSLIIPAWHIPSLNIEPVRANIYPFATTAYMGSLYMIVLLSFERYMAVRQKRQLTIKRTLVYIVSVTLFSILYNVPRFWTLETGKDEIGFPKTKRTELSCNETFYMIYLVGLNACFRYIIPTLCLIGFNIVIYKEVMLFLVH